MRCRKTNGLEKLEDPSTPAGGISIYDDRFSTASPSITLEPDHITVVRRWEAAEALAISGTLSHGFEFSIAGHTPGRVGSRGGKQGGNGSRLVVARYDADFGLR